MIRRIVILEPKSERITVFSGYELPRLGSVMLVTILRDHGYGAAKLAAVPVGESPISRRFQLLL